MQWRSAIGCFASRQGGCSSRSLASSLPTSSNSRIQYLYLFLAIAAFTSQFTGLTQLSHKSLQKTSSSTFSQSSSSYSPVFSRSDDSSRIQSISYLSGKERNRLVKAINGNRANRGIKLAHWNAGSAHLCNKSTELEQVVSGLHPHVLGISEAKFKKGHNLEDVQMENYDLLLSKTIDNDELNISRIACYKHSSMVGTVRDDLMCDRFS